MFGKGISREGDMLDLAANVGIVVKSGAWYSYNDAKIGQGRENAKQYLTENPQIMEEIDHKVRAYYGLIPQEEQDAGEKTEKDGQEHFCSAPDDIGYDYRNWPASPAFSVCQRNELWRS